MKRESASKAAGPLVLNDYVFLLPVILTSKHISELNNEVDKETASEEVKLLTPYKRTSDVSIQVPQSSTPQQFANFSQVPIQRLVSYNHFRPRKCVRVCVFVYVCPEAINN